MVSNIKGIRVEWDSQAKTMVLKLCEDDAKALADELLGSHDADFRELATEMCVLAWARSR